MIDFRYLLITVVSIFLALTVGITLGAGFLGDPLSRDLKRRIESVTGIVGDQRSEIGELNDQIDEGGDWAQSIEPWVVDGRLAGRDIVLFTIDGSDGAVIDGTREILELADADIVTEINVRQKFALPSEPEATQLATIVDSVADERRALVGETADALGEGAASLAADDAVGVDGAAVTDTEYDGLLRLLEEQDFISTSQADEETASIPPGASFVVAGGNISQEPFDTSAFVERLTIGLAGRDLSVVVSESTGSSWELARTIRESGDAGALASSVDVGDNARGRVALVLALDRNEGDPPGHFGIGDGTQPLPDPRPDDG